MVSSRMGLLPSFLSARLSAAAVISLSSPVLWCSFRALLHFVRSATKPSQDTVSMSTAFVYLTQTPQCQLTVEDVLWNATILHTASMIQPSQSALSKQSVRTPWEDQHETGHQRWLLCPARIYPGYGGCFLGGMC